MYQQQLCKKLTALNHARFRNRLILHNHFRIIKHCQVLYPYEFDLKLYASNLIHSGSININYGKIKPIEQSWLKPIPQLAVLLFRPIYRFAEYPL